MDGRSVFNIGHGKNGRVSDTAACAQRRAVLSESALGASPAVSGI